ncbi:MAG: hypothetical protein ACXITV_09055 [Luteibaculaceae bacterium]
MKRQTLIALHAGAATVALITILLFFSLSFWSEVWGGHEETRLIKTVIFFSLPILLITMPLIGLTGSKLSNGFSNEILEKKKRRMKWITIQGLILVSLASLLYYKTRLNEFDTVFSLLQIGELILGFSNIILLSLNMRAGFELRSRKKI